MAYSRGKYYIFGGKDGIEFILNGKTLAVLPDEMINVFLASFKWRKKELKIRKKLGEQMVRDQYEDIDNL